MSSISHSAGIHQSHFHDKQVSACTSRTAAIVILYPTRLGITGLVSKVDTAIESQE